MSTRQRTLCPGSGQRPERWLPEQGGPTPLCPICDRPMILANYKIAPHLEPITEPFLRVPMK